MKKTYRSIFSYPPLRLETARLSEYVAKFPCELTYPVIDKSSLFGIEVEVEGLNEYPYFPAFWQMIEDGSLRNFGREFVSTPVRGSNVEYAVRLLFDGLKKFPYDFSPRTSIHVHCNARTMTPNQLNNMLMVYLIMERLLFKFVGKDRDKNIHCVPLVESNIVANLRDIIYGDQAPSNWMKYTAVNLVPLSSMGTIEFRHMHGTDDIEKIMTWINLILKMKLYAYKTDVAVVKQEIFDLNSNSQYVNFVQRVFGDLAHKLLADIPYKELSTMMEEGVIIAKRCFSGQEYYNKLSVDIECKFAKAMGYLKKNKERYREYIDEFVSSGAVHQTLQISPGTWGDVTGTNIMFSPPPPPVEVEF